MDGTRDNIYVTSAYIRQTNSNEVCKNIREAKALTSRASSFFACELRNLAVCCVSLQRATLSIYCSHHYLENLPILHVNLQQHFQHLTVLYALFFFFWPYHPTTSCEPSAPIRQATPFRSAYTRFGANYSGQPTARRIRLGCRRVPQIT